MLPDLEELCRWLPRAGPLLLTSIFDATLKFSVTFNLLAVRLPYRLTPHQRLLPYHILELLLEAFRLGLLEKGSNLQLRLLNHLLLDCLL